MIIRLVHHTRLCPPCTRLICVGQVSTAVSASSFGGILVHTMQEFPLTLVNGHVATETKKKDEKSSG